MSPKTRRIVLWIVVVLLIGVVVAWWLSGFSLEFMRFFAAEPGTGEDTSPTPVASTPVTGSGESVQCAPATQTVTVGENAQVSASGGLSSSYAWFMPEGTPADGAGTSSVTVQYTVPGTKKVTVQADRADGSGNIDSVACTVVVTE